MSDDEISNILKRLDSQDETTAGIVQSQRTMQLATTAMQSDLTMIKEYIAKLLREENRLATLAAERSRIAKERREKWEAWYPFWQTIGIVFTACGAVPVVGGLLILAWTFFIRMIYHP